MFLEKLGGNRPMQMLAGLKELSFFPVAELEVGEHLYWQIGNFHVHGQVLLTSWFVIALLAIASFAASRNIQRVPAGIQNLMEYAPELIRDLVKKPNWREGISPLGSLRRHIVPFHLCV